MSVAAKHARITVARRSKTRAYFELTRLHKFPAGNNLLFLPCLWGVAMAAYRLNLPPTQVATLSVLYIIGGTIAHSAACIINDICDKDLDAKVERTKNRPLVVGFISVWGAVVFLLLWVAALIGLLSYTCGLAFKLGLLGIFPLHAFYPLMKRWTYWPQVWLGFTMNWGLLVAWISITREVSWNVLLPLLIGSVCWTVVYDTIYACQDRKDDVQCGIKSTAILFGHRVRPILGVFACTTVVCLAIAGFENQQRTPYFLISVAGSALHFAWQLMTLDTENNADCWKKFASNGDFGVIVWTGVMADYILSPL